ncbi:N-acetylmuramoyl-L-alanine amidase [Candidatus Aerophobetes bacterium]|nr:N-acetylmuramoyl-L-alanine amidase [Candidatus Aerophobetes bacterium]
MKKVLVLVSLFFFLFVQSSQAEQYFSVSEIKLNSQPTFSQILIRVPEGTGYVAGELSNPPRIVLNLFPLKINLAHQQMSVSDKFVQEIHLLKESENVVKVIVELNISNYNFGISFQNQAKVIVIDIRPPEKDIITALLKVEEVDAAENPLYFDPWQNAPQRKERGIYRIVIDAGHGGKDPGAIGPSGLREKDITLAIAKKLSELLKQNSQFEVVLTRSSDEFISLDRRAEIANQARGELFISIHANAGWDMRDRGVETFYNSQYAYGEGAKDVAIRENAAFGANDLPFSVQNIIWDLIQNQYRQESKELAQIVQEKLAKITGAPDRGVKSAPFYVLRGASMPAVLVEVGFISNPLEEKKLKETEYQKIITTGIHKGIVSHVNSFNKRLNTSRE